MYDIKMYESVTENFTDKGVTISAIVRSLKAWKWPAHKGELFYEWEDINGVIEPPQRSKTEQMRIFQYSWAGEHWIITEVSVTPLKLGIFMLKFENWMITKVSMTYL
jgi:hypothetical protein